MSRQGFMGMDVNDFPPASFTAVSNTTSETNLWTPAIWTPIAANDMRAGKAYKVSFGGTMGTSSAAPTAIFTARVGQSSTPASNVSLGATTAVTMTASLAAVPIYGEFTVGVRSLGLAASGATCTGNGFVVIGDLTTTAGKVLSFGGSVPTTVDNTTAQGLIVSVTFNGAATANVVTCQWALIQSLN